MKELPGGGAEPAPRHAVDRLIYIRPNPDLSAFQLKETLVHQALRFGNSYAEIERDQFGRPFALWLLHPDRVTPMRDDAGRLLYRVTNGADGIVDLDPMDLIHIRGYGDDVAGFSIAEYAAQSIGWAKAMHLFGAAFFGNGAAPSIIIRNKVPISPEALAAQQASFKQWLGGGARNAHKVGYLDQDAEVQEVGTSPADSQMVEANRFLVSECARWFGVPEHVVGELSRSTNNNIEHQAIEAVQRCLAPWVKRIEEEFDYKLFGRNPNGHFVKLNMAAILRGDFKTQAEGFRLYREMGVMSADEIRERLDLNPIGGTVGPMRTMNGSYAPLERIADGTATSAGTRQAEAV
jgi:HK97 family phage portal protein